MIRSARGVLVLALLLLAASPARAYWLREEWMGLQLDTGRQRARVLDLAAYESHWGLGVGTTVFEAITGAWDMPRFGQHDATAHALYQVFPIKGYLALASWKGPPYFHMLDSRAADRSIGKVELYGSYCGWASLTQFNEVAPDVIDVDLGRQAVPGSLTATVYDYGVRLDQGLGDSFAFTTAIGRFEFHTPSDGVFRERSYGRWYASMSLYFGETHGSDYGGGANRMFVDAWNGVSALFGGSVVHEEPLPSTTQ